MSTFQQFFPGGGSSSGGGGAGNIGGGTTPVEIIGTSGGGGGGGAFEFRVCVPDNPTVPTYYPTNPRAPILYAYDYGGCGGNGAVFYADNYFINPGTTYPITIGTGGARGGDSDGAAITRRWRVLNQPPACPTSWPNYLAPNTCAGATQGSNGGATSFNNPCCMLYVEGGGGGGGGRHNSATNASNTTDVCGLPGGTGGSGAGLQYGPNTCICGGGYTPINCCIHCYKLVRGCGGDGKYYTRLERGGTACCSTTNIIISERLSKPYGWVGGFPSTDTSCGPTTGSASCASQNALGGGSMSNVSPQANEGSFTNADVNNNFDFQ